MKIRSVIIVSIFFILLCSCNNQETKVKSDITNLEIDLKETIRDKDVSAPTLTVEFIQLDEEQAIKTLLQGQIKNKEINAFGKSIETKVNGDSESLTIYGDKETAVRGGLAYTYDNQKHRVDYDKVATRTSNPPDYIEQIYGHTLNDDYQPFSDLTFKPYKEAEREIITSLSLLDMNEVELDKVYALDKDTMLDHLKKYNDHLAEFYIEDQEPELLKLDISNEEEAYLFQFRQVIHDIPVANFIWQSRTREENDSHETFITAIYNQHGIKNLDISEYYIIQQNGEMNDLISQDKALNKVKEIYSKKILTTPTKLDEANLYYVGILEGTERKLIPVWIVRAVTKGEPQEENEPPYNEYEFITIDAITGEQITK